jgi:hypothetical protein
MTDSGVLQDDFDLKGDYVRWRQKRGFAFAAHAFLYTPASKAELLRIENQLEMCVRSNCAMLLCPSSTALEVGVIYNLALSAHACHRCRMNEVREALMYDAMRGAMHSIPYFVLKVSTGLAALSSNQHRGNISARCGW